MKPIDFPDIKVNERFVKELELPKLMGQELLTTRTRLLSNLESGRDSEGGPMRQYSEAYKEFKVSTGRSTTPNLNFYGNLYRSMTVKIPSTLTEEGKIEFHDDSKSKLTKAELASALYKKGFVGWFSYAKVDFDRVAESVSRKLDKFLSRLVDGK